VSIGITKRRIQRLGGSSLIVTIPKSWARKIGLTVGDEVVVVDEGDHLKILPPNSKLVKTLGSAQVRLAGFVRNLDPSYIAYCAYTRGFDRLILELPKSNGVTPERVAEALEESPYVQGVAHPAPGVVEAVLSPGEDAGPKSLKTVGSIIAGLLEKAARRQLTEEDLEVETSRVESLLDALVRGAYKHKVLTCSGENLDPMVVGEMRAAMAVLRELLVHVAGDPAGGEVAAAVSRLVTGLTGGIANRSGKRILEVAEMVPEAMKAIEGSRAEEQTKALALSLVRVMERIARDSLCPTILVEGD